MGIEGGKEVREKDIFVKIIFVFNKSCGSHLKRM